MATAPEPNAPRRPVVVVVTPWFPSAYEPIAGIFVGKQVEALRSEMTVMLIHTQMACELPFLKLKDFLLRRKRPAKHTTEVKPDRTFYYPFRWMVKLLGADRAWRLLSRRIRKALQRLPQKPDAVISWISWPTGCATQAASERLGLKCAVLECNGNFKVDASQPDIRPHVLSLYRGPVIKLTISHLMTRTIQETLGVDFEAHACGCVIDDSFLGLPLQRPARTTKRGLCVSSVHKDKGQQFIVEAAALLKQRGVENFEITCAGFGAGLEDFRRQAVEAGVDHLVKFPGLVTEEEKLGLYAESDFFVMPTLADTFGAVVAEAMASGLPVVSTPNGSAEWVVDEHTGILCRASDAESLAGALMEMLNRCDDFDRAVIRDRANQHFGVAAYTRGICKALSL